MNELVKAVREFDPKAPEIAEKTLNAITEKAKMAYIILSVLRDLAKVNDDKFRLIQIGKLEDLMTEILSYSWIGDDDVSNEAFS